MTRFDIERFCPYHGGYVLLAHCPIVATSEEVNGRARDDGGSVLEASLGIPGIDAPGPGFPGPGAPPGERIDQRLRAALAPELGSLLRSKVDDRTRVVLAGPAGRPRSTGRLAARLAGEALPTAVELARETISRPARACPECCHPLPDAIDDRDPYLVGLVGHPGASKTTTILALIQAVGRAGPQAFGVPELTVTGATMQYIASLDKELDDSGHPGKGTLARYREGLDTQGTDPRRHPPFEFLTTLPPSARNADAKDAIVLLQDVAGESAMNRDMRADHARSIPWSDAVLFVYNPEDAPGWPRGQPRATQAALLNDIRDDVRMRDVSGTGPRVPPLVVAVSKADLLGPPVDVRYGPGAGSAVRDALVALDDAAMIAAAQRWDTAKVSWRFIAPKPHHGGGERGVTELFSLLLSELRP